MKNRRWLFLFVLLLAACGREQATPTESPPALSFDQAAELVLEEHLQPDMVEGPVILFGHPELLTSQDELHPYQKSGHDPVAAVPSIESDSWFFWLDQEPGAVFAHDTTFLLVDADTGSIQAEEAQWWPVLNGEGLWTSEAAYWDASNWVYNNVEYQPVTANNVASEPRAPGLALPAESQVWLQQAEGSRVGLVINGWEQGEYLEEAMATSSDQMHDLLEAADFDTTYYGPEAVDNPRVDGIDADEDLGPGEQPWRMWVRQQQAELGPGDTMFLYLTGHGNVTSGGVTAAGDIFEDALKTELEGFDPGVNIIVFVDSCHSGGFVDSLKDVADLTITATDEASSSYGDIDLIAFDSNSDDEGLEFTSGFVEDWLAIFNNPSLLSDVQNRGSLAGANKWRVLSAESFVSAREKDLAYYLGATDPIISYGSPATKSAAGFAADAQVRLVATDGQGSCGQPTSYQSELEISVRDGQMSTIQPSTGDRNQGSLEEAFAFLVEREDGGESYQGQLDPETLEASGTTTYVDSSGCETTWNFRFTPQSVDFQTGPNSGMTDGASVPFADGLILVETTLGQPNYFIEPQLAEDGTFQFNVVELATPAEGQSLLDAAFHSQPPGMTFLSPDGIMQLSDAELAAGLASSSYDFNQPLPAGAAEPAPEVMLFDGQGRLILPAQPGLIRWDPATDQIEPYDFGLFYPQAASPPEIDVDQGAFILPPSTLVIPGSLTRLLNLDQPDTSTLVDLSELGVVFDITPALIEPELISISTQRGVYLVTRDEFTIPGPLLAPVKPANPTVGPGPHGWLGVGDQVPFLVHAEGSGLWQTADGQRSLIVDTGAEIVDLQFYLAPTTDFSSRASRTEAKPTPTPNIMPTPAITATVGSFSQQFGEQVDDVVVCDSGDPIDDPDGDIQRFAFRLPPVGPPQVEVFTGESPLDSFQDYSYSLQVRVGQDGNFRVVINEIHAGDPFIGEIDTNGVIAGTEGQVIPSADSVTFTFPGYTPQAGDSVTVRSFHMEEEGSPRTCDVSEAEPIRLP